MAFDAHANLASSLVVTPPSPATSGTSLTVTAGQGTLFPAVPFNATVCPASTFPTTANAEIVRVTNISSDTLTITRAQEGTSAMPIAAGYFIGNSITAKVLTDIESAIPTAGYPMSSIIAATGTNTIASGNNTGQVWNWANTTNSTVAMTLGETTVATNGTSTSGVPNQVLFKLATLAGSTEAPLSVYSGAAHTFSVAPDSPQILVAVGSVSVPTITFVNDTDTGIFSPGANIVGFAVAGNMRTQANISSLVGFLASTSATDFLSTSKIPAISAVGTEATTAAAQRISYVNATNPSIGVLSGLRARGTNASPSVITSGDDLFSISAYGYVGATNTFLHAAQILFDSTGTIADTTSGIGGQIKFYTTKAGTDTSPQLGATIQGGSVPTFTANGSISPSNSTVTWTAGSGSPESAVTAPVGSMYSRTDGGAGTSLYVKESGSGNTGWVGK